MRILIFLILNFLALAIGSIFTAKGVSSSWYNALNKAPWTPPGWVFGFAWTSIMVCFAFYMAFVWQETQFRKTIIILFALQWLLNVLWNPIFFKYHSVGLALVIIVLLSIVVGLIAVTFFKTQGVKSLFILPYIIWLLIATSLNAYIVLKN